LGDAYQNGDDIIYELKYGYKKSGNAKYKAKPKDAANNNDSKSVHTF